MSTYEAMFIFRPELNEEKQKALVAELENVLKQNQAQIENSQVFGRRHLAYEIKKCGEGLYHLINFSAQTGQAITSLKRACNINENVLRAQVVKQRRKV